MKRSVLMLLAFVLSFGAAVASPPHGPPPVHVPVHPPAHPPARPPVMVRPPTLPSQVILEQRRAHELAERRREEELTSIVEEGRTSWIDDMHLGEKPFRGYDDIRGFFKDIKPPIVGLDDETREEAKERVLSDLDNLDLPPNRKESIRREIDQRFQSDADASDKYQRWWLENVVGRFISITTNMENPSQGDITRAVGDAITSANETLLKELNVFTGNGYSNFGVSLDLRIDRTVNENAAAANVNTVVRAMRGNIGGAGSPETQIASATPPVVSPLPTTETPAVEAPTPPVQPDNAQPVVTRTPTLRETVSPSAGPSADSTQPSVTYTPTVRSIVTPSEPTTPAPDILTAIPAYTPLGGHSSPSIDPIQTTSVPTSRERFSGPPNIIAPLPRGSSFIGAVAAKVGPVIKSGLVTVANWMDDHELLGRDYDRTRYRSERNGFHGIGNGAFEGRLGYSVTPTKVGKGGFVTGSNIGGGLIQ